MTKQIGNVRFALYYVEFEWHYRVAKFALFRSRRYTSICEALTERRSKLIYRLRGSAWVRFNRRERRMWQYFFSKSETLRKRQQIRLGHLNRINDILNDAD